MNGGAVAVEAVRDALDGAVQRLLAADPVVRAGTDPEGVHQARVATRRLRSDLRTFAPLLDPLWTAALRDEVKWLGSELGPAREAEVLAGHLRSRAEALPPEAALAVSHLVDHAAGDREATQARVIEVLRSARYLELVDRLVQGAIEPRLRPDARDAGPEDLARLARTPWKKLKRDHARLGENPADAVLHALRIRAKRARYAVEAVADFIDGDAPHELATALANLQDVLGAHQDAVVAEAWVRGELERELGARRNGDRPGPIQAYAAGMLAGLLRADGSAALDDLPKAWKKTDHKRLTSWM